jgi:hypothetical protein
MTQIIITTDTPEEMRKLLSVARKNNLRFKYLAIKKKTETAAIGKVNPAPENEDLALFDAIEQGRTSPRIDTDSFLQSLKGKCK